MDLDLLWTCPCCGKQYDKLSFAYALDEPDLWRSVPEEERPYRCVLGTDSCVIDQKNYFIRGRIVIPVIDSKDPFIWGTWACVSQKSFERFGQLWDVAIRENEPPLQSLESPASEEAKLAKSAPPQLAMKAQPRPRADFQREERPSRERGTRPEREPAREWAPRNEASPAQENAGAAGTLARSAPAPAAPPAAPAAPTIDQPAKAAEQERDRIAESSEFAADKKDKALADSARESRPAAQALRKQEAVAPVRPGEWLAEIDSLLGKGKETEARRRLLEFRERYPHYPLPERLQALLAPEPAK